MITGIPILSILIATTKNRRPLFDKLYTEFKKQIKGLPVEVLYEEDNKEISIGLKRQILLNRSIGKYICYFDSDDFPFGYYVKMILQALEQEPDCVGMLIHMTTNNKKPQTCCHSLRYPVWKENVDGYDYVRNVTHFNPVLRSLAIKVGFRDTRYGEDRVYSDAVTKLCKKEAFIKLKLFHYRYSTSEPHKKKYGIR